MVNAHITRVMCCCTEISLQLQHFCTCDKVAAPVPAGLAVFMTGSIQLNGELGVTEKYGVLFADSLRCVDVGLLTCSRAAFQPAGVFTSTHLTVSFVLEIAPGATCRCSTGGSRVWNDVLSSTVFHFH